MFIQSQSSVESNQQFRRFAVSTRHRLIDIQKALGVSLDRLGRVSTQGEYCGYSIMDLGMGRMAVDDLVLSGKKLEVLGWVHILNKKANGRLYVKHGAVAAGVALNQGKGKIILSKPRVWFDEQTTASSENLQPTAADGS